MTLNDKGIFDLIYNHSYYLIFSEALMFGSCFYAVGIQTLFHCTAFLHISSISDGSDQSVSPSVSWQDSLRVLSELLQVNCRY